ncbi:MAG: phosphate ABC transporter permease subunit PstC [Candidatus Verstraetearchaeota archaeon]|nr:phosphate ABC transporter permease subunit PstC [Candidatus Verstraetearchaeota archaeon]
MTATIASSIILIIGLMFYELYLGSWLSINKFGLGFIIGSVWDPVKGIFGALPLILGTLFTSAIAILISFPISLGIALALSEYMPKQLSNLFFFFVELLAAIPSVIYGLWGIYVLIPFLREVIYPFIQSNFGFIPLFSGPIYGGGFLTTSILLAIMLIPIMSTIMREIFILVPSALKEAAISLGATKWEVISVMISYARLGIIGAIMLGLGRAIGEAMAVSMVIGNKFQLFPSSLFDAWYTMAAILANEFIEAINPLHISALINVGLLLLVINLIVSIIAKIIVRYHLRIIGGIMRE